MRLRFLFKIVLVLVSISAVLAGQGCRTVDGDAMQRAKEQDNGICLEHVALNVPEPVAMADWYCENLGMRVVKEGPPPVNGRFIADSGGKMMLEIYTNPPDAIPDYRSMNPLCLHIAFMVDDVKAVQEKLVAAGAALVEPVSTTSSGDRIAMLRDPWGVPIQFVKRAEPMLR